MRLLAFILLCIGVKSDCPCFDECSNSAGYDDVAGQCFRYYWNSKSWNAAEDKCKADGGALVTNSNYIRQYMAITDTWIGAKETSDGLQFNGGTSVPSDLIRLSGSIGDCAFLLQGGIYSWSGCGDSLGFICQKTSIVFEPTTLVLSAADGLRGNNTLNGVPQNVLLFLTSNTVCTDASIRDFNFMSSSSWDIPHVLTPGVNYSVCWYGPITSDGHSQLPLSTVLPSSLAGNVIIRIDPLPVLVSVDEKPVPEAILPHQLTVSGSGLQRNAYVGFDCDVESVPLFISLMTPSEGNNATITIPAALAVGTHRICVASLIDSTSPNPAFFTQSNFQVTVQPKPAFTAGDVFLPYSKTFPSSEIIPMPGTDLNQDFIHVGYSVSSSCGSVLHVNVLVENGSGFGSRLPAGLQTGIGWYLCYVVYRKETIDVELQYERTGIRVLITPAPLPNTSGGTVLISYPQIMNNSGHELIVKGRNFYTRGSSSDLFLSLAGSEDCSDGTRTSSQLESSTIQAVGTVPSGSTPGTYFACLSVGNDLVVLPTNIKIVISQEPDLLSSEIIPVTAVPQIVSLRSPQTASRIKNENQISVSGLLLSVSTVQSCDDIVSSIATDGELPLMNLTSHTTKTSVTDLYLCWGYHPDTDTTIWNTTEVIYRIIPSSTIQSNQFIIQRPLERFSNSFQVGGSFMTSLVVYYSRSDCTSERLYSFEKNCSDLYCSQFDIIIDSDMVVGDYVVCGNTTTQNRISIGRLAILRNPVFEETTQTVSVMQYYEGFTIPISVDGINSFVVLSWGTGDERDNNTFTLSNPPIYTFGPSNDMLSPGNTIPLHWKTASQWHSSNQYLKIASLPVYMPTPVIAISVEELMYNRSVLISLGAVNTDEQIVYYKLCSSISVCIELSDLSSTTNIIIIQSSEIISMLKTTSDVVFTVYYSLNSSSPIGDFISTFNVVQFPILNPLLSLNNNIQLTYGESLSGVDISMLSNEFISQSFGDVVPTYCLKNSITAITTPFKELTASPSSGRNTFYRSELPVLSADVVHNLLIRYSAVGQEDIDVLTSTQVTWSPRPTFEGSESTVSRIELLSMFDDLQTDTDINPIIVVVRGSSFDGIFIRIGCSPIPQPLGTTPALLNSSTNEVHFVITNNITSSLVAETYPLCWAPVHNGFPDWALGGVVEGVVITFEPIPIFANLVVAVSSSTLLNKEQFLNYEIDLSVESTSTSAFQGVQLRFCNHEGSDVSGFISQFNVLLDSPILKPFASSNYTGPDIFKNQTIKNERLCWSVDGTTNWYPIEVVISTDKLPKFESSKNILFSEETEATASVIFTSSQSDEVTIISSMNIFPSDTSNCDSRINDRQVTISAPTVSVRIQPFALNTTVVYLCWSPVGWPSEIVDNFSIRFSDLPVVTNVNSILPWVSTPTLRSINDIAVRGSSLQNLIIVIPPIEVGCNSSYEYEKSNTESILRKATGEILQHLVSGGTYSLCYAVGNVDYLRSADLSQLVFNNVPGTETGFVYEKSRTGETQIPSTDIPETLQPTAVPTAQPTEVPVVSKTVVVIPTVTESHTLSVNNVEESKTATREVQPRTETVIVTPTETVMPIETVNPTETVNPIINTITNTFTISNYEPATDTLTQQQRQQQSTSTATLECPSAAQLGEDLSSNCFNNFNEAGRLVGCLRSMSLTDSCLEQYDRCAGNVIGDCDPTQQSPENYKITSIPLGVILGLTVDDFTGELFSAAVADSLKIVPSTVNITLVKEGSVDVHFQILGPDGDDKMTAFQKILADGENPFSTFNWDILEYRVIVPKTESPSDSSNDVEIVLQIMTIFTVVVGFGIGIVIYLLKKSISNLKIEANLREVHRFSGVNVVKGSPSINDLVSKGKPLPRTPGGESPPAPNPPTRLFGSPADEINNTTDIVGREAFHVSRRQSDFLTDI